MSHELLSEYALIRPSRLLAIKCGLLIPGYHVAVFSYRCEAWLTENTYVETLRKITRVLFGKTLANWQELELKVISWKKEAVPADLSSLYIPTADELTQKM